MANRMTSLPETATTDRLVQVYTNIPKRILWDLLMETASQVDRKEREPGDWILAEAVCKGVWFPKALLKREEPEATAAVATEQEEPAKKKPARRASRKGAASGAPMTGS